MSENQTAKTKAIYARKVGMTQFFDAQGLAHGATVLEATPARILNIRTKDKDGYSAVQLGFGKVKKEMNMGKALAGQFKKVGADLMEWVKEIRLRKDDPANVQGGTWSLEGMFNPGDYVDVRGISKGHGFTGTVKRWNFKGGPATHGQSDRERAPGSLAGRRSLGRVLPGKKMAGHWGVETVTVYKMEVLNVDTAQHKIYVKGGVPGTNGSYVFVHETVKSRKKKLPPKISSQSAKKKAVSAKAPAKK